MHLNTHSVVILIIMINKNKNDFSVIKSGVFQPCQRHYHYVKGCNSGASQRILSEQVVTCLVHSKELILPSTGREGAAGGGGGGCTIGRYL